MLGRLQVTLLHMNSISPRDTWCPVSGSNTARADSFSISAHTSVQAQHERDLASQIFAEKTTRSRSLPQLQLAPLTRTGARTACAMGRAQQHQEVPGVLITRMVQSLTLCSDCSLFQIKAIPSFQSSESSGVGLFLTHHGYKPLRGAVTHLCLLPSKLCSLPAPQPYTMNN